jgi:hypothetical protein
MAIKAINFSQRHPPSLYELPPSHEAMAGQAEDVEIFKSFL